MANNELIEAVRSAVAETLGLAPDDLNENAGMDTVAEWTSLQHLAVIAAVEERFGIEMDMDEMTSATTIAALADMVSAHGGGA